MRSPALALAVRRLSGPEGRLWNDTTIHGHAKRGTGIINNELYIGRLVWNRLRYLKDPSTSKRVSRINPESEWTVTEVPELRVLDDNLWPAELAKVEKDIRGVIEAIKAGMFHESTKGEMTALEIRKAELTALLVEAPQDVPNMLSSAAGIYAKRIARQSRRSISPTNASRRRTRCGN